MSVPRESQARHRLSLAGLFDGDEFRTEATPTIVKESLEPRRCFAIFGLRGKRNVPGEMIVVKDGVELTRLTPPSFPKGVSVIVVAEGLRLDLSQFRLIDSPETQKRLLWISSMVRAAARFALARLPSEDLSAAEQQYLEVLTKT